MKVVSLHSGGGLLEADVVKSGKGRAVDVFNSVVGYKEMLLPTHEYKVSCCQCVVVKRVTVECLGVLFELREFSLQRGVRGKFGPANSS